MKKAKSMKVQLFVVLVLIVLIPGMIACSLVSDNYLMNTVNQKTLEITRSAAQMSNLLTSTGYFQGKQETTAEAVSNMSQMADMYDGRIVVVNNKYKVIGDTFTNGMAGSYNISQEVIQAMGGTVSTSVNYDQKYIQIAYPINSSISMGTIGSKSSNDNAVIGVLLMSMNISDVYTVDALVAEKTSVIVLIIALLVCMFALWFSHITTKPFQRLTSSIDHMAEGYFDETITLKGYAEVEGIAESFNKMIARIQQLENSRQEFVSNVSHELKTPITSIKVLAESLLTQEEAPAELYREFLHDITDEIERENEIINDLLSLVKLDKTSGELNVTSCNINELMELILKRLRPIAAKRNVELIFESFRPVIADIDEVKLSLAISNLVENAIKYNYDDGWVRVSLNADHKFFYIKVMDSGVGIPEDVQDHIFERFYRVDKARSRETGGTGLGLSITRNAILMHRGAIKLYSKEKEGSTFTVRVPLNYIA